MGLYFNFNLLGNTSETDILKIALTAKKFFNLISTGKNTTNVPNNDFKYCPGFVLRRTSSDIAILLIGRNNQVATNFNNGVTWTGWKIR